MGRKAALYPERYRLDGLKRIRSVREFDDVVTAPHCGYRDASDYYQRASALRVAAQIRVPALILTAQDDPFVPFGVFHDAAIAENPAILLEAPPHGGHCAFISNQTGEHRFWAESRILEFCKEHARKEGSGRLIPAGLPKTSADVA
jgi:predicted alpha/beta-fold hydrolase